MKIGAIIEARMESTRLPGKILLPLAGKPDLLQLINRVQRADKIDRVIVACPDTPLNKIIEQMQFYALQYFDVFYGSMDNVIKRVVDAAIYYKIDAIVSITADCPLVDPSHIDHLINMYLDSPFKYKYVSNIEPRTWPDGLDIQIYPTFILQEAMGVITNKLHFSHSGWNILNYRSEISKKIHDFFNHIYNWGAPEDLHLPELGLTLDELDDYFMLAKIFNRFGNDFRVEEIIYWLKENPKEICNKNVKRKIPGEG